MSIRGGTLRYSFSPQRKVFISTSCKVRDCISGRNDCHPAALIEKSLFLISSILMCLTNFPLLTAPQVHISTSERPVVAGHPPECQRQSVEPGCGQRAQHHTWYMGECAHRKSVCVLFRMRGQGL